jgi:serine/threonine-protein kinase ATR
MPLCHWLTVSKVVQGHLAEFSSPTNRDPLLKLRLPVDGFFESLSCGQVRPLQEQCTYTLNLASQALRHASHLLSLLSIPLVDYKLSSNSPQPFHGAVPWLIDAAVRMNITHNRWGYLSPSCLPQLVQTTIKIADIMKLLVNTDPLVEEKTYVLLVHLCAEVLIHRRAVSGAGDVINVDDKLLSVAALRIAEACLLSVTVSRFASLQIIPIIEKPIDYEKIASPETDLWVSQEKPYYVFDC